MPLSYRRSNPLRLRAWSVRQLMKVPATLVLFGMLTTLVRAQSALDGFDPNANGTIAVAVIQPDGKVLIGGDFTTLSPNGGGPVTRNYIARLNPDGTLDTAFDPGANGVVVSMALQANGKILVAGDFTSMGGQQRNRIARLDAITGGADSFDPNADNNVNAIGVQADGKVLAAGAFTSIGGQPRNRIARLDPTTSLADSFDPNANSDVRAVVVQGDGKILVGGAFSGVNGIGGQTRNFIARLNPDGMIDAAFNPNANGQVLSIAIQADGKILVGGTFSGVNSIGGQTRNRIARLDTITGSADSFNPNANDRVASMSIQADGKILAGGAFSGINSIGGQTRNGIARLDPASGLADSFDPNAANTVLTVIFSIAVQADGKIVAGGNFSTLAPNGGAAVTRNCIARLENDGRLDQTLYFDASGGSVNIFATAVQADGKILIGGEFTHILGVARSNIARLNTDGTLDAGFDPNARGSAGEFPHVDSIAVQPDGKVLVGGFFTSIGGRARNNIARLDPTTGFADSFDPNANRGVYSITVQADSKILAAGFFNSIGGQPRNFIARLDADTGLADSFNPNLHQQFGGVLGVVVQPNAKILVGGTFSNVSGVARNNIARLNIDGSLDTLFNPNANGEVNAIAMQTDGKILVGGHFTSIGGQTRNRIARLDADTGLADSFNPDANAQINSIALQGDQQVIMGGHFTSIAGQNRNAIARLDASTGIADSFDPGPANAGIYSIAMQGDGKILPGGNFYGVGSEVRRSFGRLTNNTAALQNLAVTQTSITWVRGGSAPHLTRVTFEYSTDNLNYTLLGNGTPSASNWNLPGLSFSTGQNFYIRARGYYRNGHHNGSESITESVRNAFIAGTADSDGDSLPDDWETNGVSIDGVFIDLKKMGADPRHKDLFIHVDRMAPDPSRPNYNFQPSPRAIQMVIDAFAIAPVPNPDGRSGVTVHVDYGPTSIMKTAPRTPWGVLSRAREVPYRAVIEPTASDPPYRNWPETDALKALYFTPAKRGGIFHYALYCDTYSREAKSGGASRGYGATDFLVALGSWRSPGGEPIKESSVFMHELGHNLGLYHAGDPNDRVDRKPNYLSIMNIRFGSIGVLAEDKQRVIDYSRVVLDTLDETQLRESTGINDPDGHLTTWNAYTRPAPNQCTENASYFTLFYPSKALDWNCDGAQTPSSPPLEADLNGDGQCVSAGVDKKLQSSPGGDDIVIGPFVTTGPNRTCETIAAGDDIKKQEVGFVEPNSLRGYNDWSALDFSGGGGIGEIGRSATSRQYLNRSLETDALLEELTMEQLIAEAPPILIAEQDAAPLDVVSFAPEEGQAPLLVTLDGSASTPVNGTIVDWSWDFGDGTAGSGATVTHTYNSPGEYYASLTVTDSYGQVNLVPLLNLITVRDSAGPAPTPIPGLVGNVATRLPVGTGDNALIQGFIVQGPVGSTKKIMVRALGPFLTQFGITDALANPTLEIRDGTNVVVATNNDWKNTQLGGIITGDQLGEISGSGLAPSDDLEPAIVANLLPGNYTAVVRGVGDTTGTGIVDAYDMSAGSPARLANIATRGFIQPGDQLMIAGFIIQNASVRAAVRAIGPSLTQFGITNALPDTTLEVRDQNGGILLENDNWKTNPAQKQELESNGLQPGHDLEAALIMTIAPGQYTAQVRGKGQDSGIGVVEVYFLQ